jgi:hypothetical protein
LNVNKIKPFSTQIIKMTDPDKRDPRNVEVTNATPGRLEIEPKHEELTPVVTLAFDAIKGTLMFTAEVPIGQDLAIALGET